MQIQFPLILDGATGTELQKRGFTGDVSAEEWVLAHPEAIADIQRGYVQAGSQVLYCPSFGANRQKLEEHGIFNKTADYNRRLAELSKKAAEGRALIAGDLSPTGLFLAPMGQASFEELVDIYADQAAGLEQAGVDLYVIETMMTLSDARAAVLAVRNVSEKPILVTFTCDENGRSISGTDITAALTAGISAGRGGHLRRLLRHGCRAHRGTKKSFGRGADHASRAAAYGASPGGHGKAAHVFAGGCQARSGDRRDGEPGGRSAGGHGRGRAYGGCGTDKPGRRGGPGGRAVHDPKAPVPGVR